MLKNLLFKSIGSSAPGFPSFSFPLPLLELGLADMIFFTDERGLSADVIELLEDRGWTLGRLAVGLGRWMARQHCVAMDTRDDRCEIRRYPYPSVNFYMD